MTKSDLESCLREKKTGVGNLNKDPKEKGVIKASKTMMDKTKPWAQQG